MGLRELARRVGVSPAYLSLVETGKLGPPTGVRLAQIAGALAIPPSALLHLTGRTDPAVLEFLHRVPETVELMRAVMDAGLTAPEIAGLSRTLRAGCNGAVGPLLDPIPGRTAPGPSELLDRLDERLVYPRVPCGDRDSLFDFLAGEVALSRRLDPAAVFSLLKEREALCRTAVGEGIAVPHARVPGLASALVAVARSPEGIEYRGAEGRPVKLVFMVLSPVAETQHLHLLAGIAELCSGPRFVADMLAASGRRQMIAVIQDACVRPPAPDGAEKRAPASRPARAAGRPAGEGRGAVRQRSGDRFWARD